MIFLHTKINPGGNPRTTRVYFKCPNGHLLGGNLISEVYVYHQDEIDTLDFFTSRQLIEAKMGVLRPEPLYLCSPAFRKMVIEEKLTGFDFDVAHIE